MSPYEIIYADPPWSYNNTQKIQGAIKNPSDAYQTLSLKELKRFTLPAVAPDAIMFMWTTGPWMGGSIELMKAWGFDYKTVAFVWDKRHVNPGFYTVSQIEYCLLGKRGKIPVPRGSRKEKQFLSERRREHSRKPDEFRDRITRMFPTQRKVELFARSTAPGWDAIGNEVGKFDMQFRVRLDPNCTDYLEAA